MRGGGYCLDRGDFWIWGGRGLFVLAVVRTELTRQRLVFFDTQSLWRHDLSIPRTRVLFIYGKGGEERRRLWMSCR